MVLHDLFERIQEHLDAVLAHREGYGRYLWEKLCALHPADIVDICSLLDRQHAYALFAQLPHEIQAEVFVRLADTQKVEYLAALDEGERRGLLSRLSVDELTDFFDDLSDKDLKLYITLLHKKDRAKVLELIQFSEESVGGAMDTEVITLMQEFSVEKSVRLLQRLRPDRELHREIFVTDQENHLVGHILLEDLVLRPPKTRLKTILRQNPLVAFVEQDREEVAKNMVRYELMTVPVVDTNSTFLGVIPTSALIEILEEESSEDIFRMASMSPIRHTYFETPFATLLYQRGVILVGLLLAQSVSSMIMQYYQDTLSGILVFFITMLTSTGGNTSSQTSALVIQGLATGEIRSVTINRFLKREFLMAMCLAGLLGLVALARVYVVYGDIVSSVAVSLSLSCIVMLSITLGSCIPLVLRRFAMDPAHSAGPVLATIMDIVGLFVYCIISMWIFHIFM